MVNWIGRWLVTAIFLLSSAGVSKVDAETFGYSNLLNFQDAVAGYDIHVNDFESYRPYANCFTNGSTIDGTTYKLPGNSISHMNVTHLFPTTSGDNALGMNGFIGSGLFSDVHQIDFSFEKPVHAFGFHLLSKSPYLFDVFLHTPWVVTMADQPTKLSGGFNDYFMGVVSSNPFSTATLSFFGHYNSGFLIDDVIRAHEPSPSSVPEPGSALLLGAGILGLTAFTRRKNR